MKTIDQMLVTPEQAANWLSRNTRNRPIRRNVVERYKVAMTPPNEWGVNHQGYLISSDGEVLDGQHRMTAQVEAGVSIRINVTFLEKNDAGFEPLKSEVDTGCHRTVGDITLLSNRLVAICNSFPVLARYRRGNSRLYPKLSAHEVILISNAIGKVTPSASTTRRGLTAFYQAIFVCAAHYINDADIMVQWSLLTSESESDEKWPLVRRVRERTLSDFEKRTARYTNNSTGGSARRDEHMSLWWLAVSPKYRFRTNLHGLHAYYEDARTELATAARAIMVEAGVITPEEK